MRFTTISAIPEEADGFSHKHWLTLALFLSYLGVWIALAISPLDRHDWLLENTLAVTLVFALIITYRRFTFSDLSYVLITLFLILHAVGAHYTYAKVPLGFWV